MNNQATLTLTKMVLEIRWIPPEYGWMKINVDGASKGNPGEAGCDGLVREDSRAIWGYAKQ